MIGRSIWQIDMGDRYWRSDINVISIGISIWNMGYRYGTWCIDMVIYHIDMVILDIDMGDEANDMGDDSIDTVISHIDMGYLVTLYVTQAVHSPRHVCRPGADIRPRFGSTEAPFVGYSGWFQCFSDQNCLRFI